MAVIMNRSLEQILQEQEKSERISYQSAETIRQMIQDDFINSTEILQVMEANEINLVELFKKPSLIFWSRKVPVPIRKCGLFHGAKHTLSQIPYLHSHSFYEYIYVVRGACVQYVGSQEERVGLKAHQSCLLAPGVSHLMERCRQEDLILKFSISEQIFQETFVSLPYRAVKGDYTIFEHGNAWTDLYASRLLQESVSQDQFFETAVRNYLSLLFIELTRAASRPSAEMIKQLEAYCETKQKEKSLKQFAAQIGYSADYAGRMIKSITGRTFGEYLRDRRLMKAAEQLLETDDTVEQISIMSGYETISGFYKQFRRVYGMTPGEYRKILKESSGKS